MPTLLRRSDVAGRIRVGEVLKAVRHVGRVRDVDSRHVVEVHAVVDADQGQVAVGVEVADGIDSPIGAGSVTGVVLSCTANELPVITSMSASRAVPLVACVGVAPCSV